MTTLTITATTDFRVFPASGQITGQNRTGLTFSGSSAITATFANTQFGGGNISNSVLLTGRTGLLDGLQVLFDAAGTLDASGWTFSNWGPEDVVTIVGSGGNDSIVGSSVADFIRPGAGVDTVSAGGGDDIILLTDAASAPAAGEVLNGGSGTDTLRLYFNGAKSFTGATLSNIETLDLGSFTGNLTLLAEQVGTAPGAVRTIMGSGTHALTISTTASWSSIDMRFVTLSGIDAVTLIGTSNADTLIGSTLNDSITGGAGNDLLMGNRAAESSLGVGSGVLNRAAGTANGSIASALTIGGVWSTAANANIGGATSLPHISTTSAADGLNIRHYYRLELADNQVVLLDIDSSSGFDPVMRLLDATGAVLRVSDDAPTTLGAGGSLVSTDPFMAFRAPEAGVYYVEIGAFGGGSPFVPTVNPVPAAGTYTLHVSTALRPAVSNNFDTIVGGDGADTIIGDDGIFIGGAGADVMLANANAEFVIENAADLAGDIIDSGAGFPLGTLVLPTGVTEASWQRTVVQDILSIKLSPGFTQLPARFFRDGGFSEQVSFDTQGYSLFTQYYPQFMLDDQTPFIDASGFRFEFSSLELAWEFSGSRFEFLSSGTAAKTITATAFRDYIWLGSSNDLVRAGARSDLVGAGAGDDTIFGEDGDDFLYGDSFENNATGRDLIWGGAGNDLIEGYGGDDTLLGDAGNDTIAGGAGNDLIYGWEGDDDIYDGFSDSNDTMFGEQGNDRLDGGDGNDLLWGGDGADTLGGGEGDDVLLGEAGADSLDGFYGADLLYGWTGADTLEGNDGNDTLFGEQDNDSLDGGFNSDLLWGGDGDDVLRGGFGEGSNGRDTLLGEAGNDTMFGQGSDDVLYGWIGHDVLWGEAGNDSLLGEDGNDTFIGGLGRDTMTGGQGADRFFNANFEMAAGEVDLITDYDAADRYLFQTGAQIQYFNFNAPGYGVGACIHVQVAGGVFILDVFGATAAQLQAQTQFF